MENTNNQPSTPDTSVTPPTQGGVVPPVSPSQDPATVKATPPQSHEGVSKNKLLLVLVVVFVVVAGAIVGYYFYQNSKTPPQAVTVPVVQPTEIPPTPTIDQNIINNDAQLEEAVQGMEDATTEAELNSELNNLKQDANF